jgi:uncharacterized protein (TIGR04255 family)
MADVIFEKPPVVEVILGVQFDPILDLSNAHFGWFWREYLGKNWTQTRNAAPIQDQVEVFGDEPTWGALGIRFGVMDGSETARCQFSIATGEHLVQVQPGHFYFNWQKREQTYPRYLAVKKEFLSHFETFKKFVADAGLGEVRPRQWEVTYLNHLPQGDLWKESADVPELLPGLLPSFASLSGQRLDAVNGNWRFEILPKRGRVHVNLQTAGVGMPPKLVLQMTITARGPIHPEKGDLDRDLDIGHDAALATFFAITSPAALAAWKPVPA